MEAENLLDPKNEDDDDIENILRYIERTEPQQGNEPAENSLTNGDRASGACNYKTSHARIKIEHGVSVLNDDEQCPKAPPTKDSIATESKESTVPQESDGNNSTVNIKHEAGVVNASDVATSSRQEKQSPTLTSTNPQSSNRNITNESQGLASCDDRQSSNNSNRSEARNCAPTVSSQDTAGNVKSEGPEMPDEPNKEIEVPGDEFFNQIKQDVDSLEYIGIRNPLKPSSKSEPPSQELPPEDLFDGLGVEEDNNYPVKVDGEYPLEEGELTEEYEAREDERSGGPDERKKRKKSKKKSRKRHDSSSRERSHSLDRSSADRKRVRMDELPNQVSQPRLHVKPEYASSSAQIRVRQNMEAMDIQENEPVLALQVNQAETSLMPTIASSSRLGASIKAEPVLSIEDHWNPPVQTLSAREKADIALARVAAAKALFAKALNGPSDRFDGAHGFLYTRTVRKLPTARGQVYIQQVYDNRSPLNTVQNVSYSFNSHKSSFNLREYGLEVLPKEAARVARVLGINVETVLNKIQTTKIHQRIRQVNNDPSKDAGSDNENEVIVGETSHLPADTTFVKHVKVQTDDVTILAGRRCDAFHDLGVQTEPFNRTRTCQTEWTGPLLQYEEGLAPIINRIQGFNENQLQAVDEFTELIMHPERLSNIDVWNNKRSLSGIYDTALKPSIVQRHLMQRRELSSEAPPPAPSMRRSQSRRDPRRPPSSPVYGDYSYDARNSYVPGYDQNHQDDRNHMYRGDPRH